jgi:hypothetical protein
MPASKDGDVQTDRTDGRKFITIKVASNGRVAYRKIHLRTTNHRLARRRARALESIDDPEEARRIVAYLASAKTPGQENDRLAELTDTLPTIPSLSHEDARKELEKLVCPYGDYEPGELDDEVVDKWRAAVDADIQRDILVELGVPDDYLAHPRVFLPILKAAAERSTHATSPCTRR